MLIERQLSLLKLLQLPKYLIVLSQKADSGETYNKGLIRVALLCIEADYI